MITLKNGKVFDNGRFVTKDLSFEERITAGTGKEKNVSGLWILPGLVDSHAHLREPGITRREDIISGANAAAHGGITTVFAMPNTEPATDTEEMVNFVSGRARGANAKIRVVGAITKGRKGKELAEMGRMAKAGAIGFSDDGAFLSDSTLARHAMEYAAELGLPIISHCQDESLGKGHMREGWFSTLYGVYATPAAAESVAVAREIELSYLTGARVHIAHVSTERTVKLIRHAKADGIKVTCDVCVHHMLLKDEDLGDYDTSKKINPPLPTAKDQEELYRGLEDGTIDAIITDHAPYASEEKEVEFQSAPFGIVGFETLLNELLMVSKKGIPIETLLKKVTEAPAKIYGIDVGKTEEGMPADLTIFDPAGEWAVSEKTLESKAKNTPFLGKTLEGRVLATFLDGRLVYGDEKWNRM